jgi:hypothetical protein
MVGGGILSSDIAANINELAPHEFYGFASFLEGRTNGVGWNYGEYKRHKTLAHAKSAISNTNSRGYTRRLYQWDESTSAWVEIKDWNTKK